MNCKKFFSRYTGSWPMVGTVGFYSNGLGSFTPQKGLLLSRISSASWAFINATGANQVIDVFVRMYQAALAPGAFLNNVPVPNYSGSGMTYEGNYHTFLVPANTGEYSFPDPLYLQKGLIFSVEVTVRGLYAINDSLNVNICFEWSYVDE